MPTCHFTPLSNDAAYLLWRIDEPLATLIQVSTPNILAEAAYKSITHPRRQREWLAARLALQTLLTKLGHSYSAPQKDEWGRPYLPNSPLHLSLAHCPGFALVAVANHQPIGVDIQCPSNQLWRVRTKFLMEEEVRESENDLEKLCIYWCAKEAIYKAHGGQGISLKQDIIIQSFTKGDQGSTVGQLKGQCFRVHYRFYEGHLLAWCSEAA
jgi:phosphopantetheinyl transferase